MKQIYIDLDGVLADLHGGLRRHFNLSDSIADRSTLFKSYLPQYTAANGFETQAPLEKSHDLVNYLIAIRNDGRANLAILTSAGQFFRPTSEIVRQKVAFVEREFPQLVGVPFCATTSGADKAYLAHPNAFLIDDWHKNITHFCAAGGHGVVYSPAEYHKTILAIKAFC